MFPKNKFELNYSLTVVSSWGRGSNPSPAIHVVLNCPAYHAPARIPGVAKNRFDNMFPHHTPTLFHIVPMLIVLPIPLPALKQPSKRSPNQKSSVSKAPSAVYKIIALHHTKKKKNVAAFRLDFTTNAEQNRKTFSLDA